MKFEQPQTPDHIITEEAQRNIEKTATSEKLRKEVREKLMTGTLIPKKSENESPRLTYAEKQAKWAAANAGKDVEEIKRQNVQNMRTDRRESGTAA